MSHIILFGMDVVYLRSLLLMRYECCRGHDMQSMHTTQRMMKEQGLLKGISRRGGVKQARRGKKNCRAVRSGGGQVLENKSTLIHESLLLMTRAFRMQQRQFILLFPHVFRDGEIAAICCR